MDEAQSGDILVMVLTNGQLLLGFKIFSLELTMLQNSYSLAS
jgi:hypothetical protein